MVPEAFIPALKCFTRRRIEIHLFWRLNSSMVQIAVGAKMRQPMRPVDNSDPDSETAYYFENGLRKVYPYYFTFSTFARGAWIGERLVDVLSREFRKLSAEEFDRRFEAGLITVNHEKVNAEYVIKTSDLLQSTVHRHELPVTADPVTIVHEDGDIVVVNKPSSIPVHPCGKYRQNTVLYILSKEFGLSKLKAAHRIDRLTSGLLILGKTSQKIRQFKAQMLKRNIEKEYICRVEGEFPGEEVTCSEPVEVLDCRVGICLVSPRGKESSTSFRRLGYHPETDSSVVLCLPHTGRQHQIRVHLQYLGYPILNDPVYNHEELFGAEKGKRGNYGRSAEELIQYLFSHPNCFLGLGDRPSPTITKRMLQFTNENKDRRQMVQPSVSPSSNSGSGSTFDPGKLVKDPFCEDCAVGLPDPRPEDLIMYLHAWKYKGPGWSYETELPQWAGLDWTDSAGRGQA